MHNHRFSGMPPKWAATIVLAAFAALALLGFARGYKRLPEPVNVPVTAML